VRPKRTRLAKLAPLERGARPEWRRRTCSLAMRGWRPQLAPVDRLGSNGPCVPHSPLSRPHQRNRVSVAEPRPMRAVAPKSLARRIKSDGPPRKSVRTTTIRDSFIWFRRRSR